jgi:N-acetylmuramoyl-L-alanine amidase
MNKIKQVSDIKFVPCHLNNYLAGRVKKIEYIVMHYTANNGDIAKNNADYYSRTAKLNASANYFVDEYETVYQSVKDTDTAWHCGGGLQGAGGHAFYEKCLNSNSVGVEMCSRKDGNGRYYIKDETMANAAALVRELMAKYGVPAGRVIRHYDVTGKNCPEPLVKEAAWAEFKAQLRVKTEELEMSKIIDELVGEFGETSVKSAIRDLIVARKNEDWKVAGSDWLHANAKLSSVHNQNEPVTFGVLGTVLSKSAK